MLHRCFAITRLGVLRGLPASAVMLRGLTLLSARAPALVPVQGALQGAAATSAVLRVPLQPFSQHTQSRQWNGVERVRWTRQQQRSMAMLRGTV